MISEYVGLTAEAITLIERRRLSPEESRSDIIVRALSAGPEKPVPASPKRLDLGQGAFLLVGERPRLFLTEEAKRANRADAVAEVREDGLYLSGEKIEPSRGSVLQPAMHQVQNLLNHRNNKGEIISLSAWRQWHVERDGKLLSMVELKDPDLARKRSRKALTIDDL